jgi:hypothetical protein
MPAMNRQGREIRPEIGKDRKNQRKMRVIKQYILNTYNHVIFRSHKWLEALKDKPMFRPPYFSWAVGEDRG